MNEPLIGQSFQTQVKLNKSCCTLNSLDDIEKRVFKEKSSIILALLAFKTWKIVSTCQIDDINDRKVY